MHMNSYVLLWEYLCKIVNNFMSRAWAQRHSEVYPGVVCFLFRQVSCFLFKHARDSVSSSEPHVIVSFASLEYVGSIVIFDFFPRWAWGEITEATDFFPQYNVGLNRQLVQRAWTKSVCQLFGVQPLPKWSYTWWLDSIRSVHDVKGLSHMPISSLKQMSSIIAEHGFNGRIHVYHTLLIYLQSLATTKHPKKLNQIWHESVPASLSENMSYVWYLQAWPLDPDCEKEGKVVCHNGRIKG